MERGFITPSENGTMLIRDLNRGMTGTEDGHLCGDTVS